MKTNDITSKQPTPVPRDEPITPPIRTDIPSRNPGPPEPHPRHAGGVGIVPTTDVSARTNGDEFSPPPQKPDSARGFRSQGSAKLGVDKASDEPIHRTTTTDLHKVKSPASVTAATRSKRVSRAVAAGIIISGLLAIGMAVVRGQR